MESVITGKLEKKELKLKKRKEPKTFMCYSEDIVAINMKEYLILKDFPMLKFISREEIIDLMGIDTSKNDTVIKIKDLDCVTKEDLIFYSKFGTVEIDSDIDEEANPLISFKDKVYEEYKELAEYIVDKNIQKKIKDKKE